MKKISKEKRIEYWKYLQAALTFDQAKEVLDYLKDNSNTPLFGQLITSLYVLYGRPFKQRRITRIPDDIIPAKFKDTHKMLLDLRDKLFAHIDIDGIPETEVDQLYKIILRRKNNIFKPATASLLPEGLQFEKISELFQILQKHFNKKADEIFNEAMDGYPPTNSLNYEVDITTADDAYLIKLATFPNYAGTYNL